VFPVAFQVGGAPTIIPGASPSQAKFSDSRRRHLMHDMRTVDSRSAYYRGCLTHRLMCW
jgi:hypothetical protein